MIDPLVFSNLKSYLLNQDLTLKFAMNAGMFRKDQSLAGHYVEAGNQYRQVICKAGPGNFGILPNGVFCIAGSSVKFFETNDFLVQTPTCKFATQSGPMLVIGGALHPRFLENSTSKFVRNGLGTTDQGDQAYFVISDTVLTFHQFARRFKDYLGIKNALYYDVNVSLIVAPSLDSLGIGRPVGPITAVLDPANWWNQRSIFKRYLVHGLFEKRLCLTAGDFDAPWLKFLRHFTYQIDL